MNKDDRAILIGMALGDGYINVRRRLKDGKYAYESSELRIVHSVKQRQYCLYKAALIKSILGGRFEVKDFVHKPPSFKGKAYSMVGFSCSNNYWKNVKYWLYPNGVKTFTRELLDMCNEHSLALWYMDDGHLRPFYKNGFMSSCSIDLATMCSEEEAKVIQQWLWDKWQITMNIRRDKRVTLKKQFYLQANTKEARKFCKVIMPFIETSMMYKMAHVSDCNSTSAEHPSG